MFIFNHLFRLVVFSWIITVLSGSVVSAVAVETPEIFVQIGHQSTANAIEISPDNKFILSGSDDRSIKLWEGSTGRLIRTFKDNDYVKFVSFLPGGKSFFSLNYKGNVCIWDIQSGNKIKEFSLGDINISSLRSAVSFNGTTLWAIVGIKLYAADISTGTIIQSMAAPQSAPLSSHFGYSFGYRNVITADGRRMLSTVLQDPSESSIASKYKRLMFWDITTGSIISSFAGHEDLIEVMALSPDETLALSGSRDKTVRLWDLKKGKALATFTGHQKTVEAVAFSPNRKYALSGSQDNTMKLWDIDEGKEIRTFAHDFPVKFVRFSLDGLFALSSDHSGAVHIWDLKTGQEVKTLKSYATNTYAFALSKDGTGMLTGSNNGQIRLWDMATGKLKKTISAHSEVISAVNFTPNGKYALSSSWDKTLKLWDLNEGTLQKTFSGHRGQVYNTVISPDGSLILSSAQGGDVRLWDISRGKEVKIFKFPGTIHSIGFSDNGHYLLIAHDSEKSGHVVKVLTLNGKEVKRYDDVYLGSYANHGRYFLANKFKEPSGRETKLFDPGTTPEKQVYRRDRYNRKTLVDIADGNVLGRFGESGAFVYISISANNDTVLTRNYYDRDLCLWNVRTGEEMRRFPTKFGLLSPDSTKVITPAGKSVQTFDAATGHSLPAFKGSAAGNISAFAISVKGGYAMTGDDTGAIQFWNIDDGTLIKTIKAEAREAILAVTFSPDNRYAASLARFGAVKIWDLREGRKVSEFKTDFVPPYYDEMEAGEYVDYGQGILAFSPDSRYLASGTKLWEVASGRKTVDFQTPFGPGPWVTFSPDGHYLLSRNMIWDVSTGRRLKTFEHIKDARSIYSPDGNLVYAADVEGPLYVVDSDTGKLVRKFINFVAAGRFEVAPDKISLISAEYEFNDLTLWDLPSGKKRASIEVHQDISSVLLSPDAHKAIVNNWASVRQFNLTTGKEIAQFISFTDGEWIVITPEGYYSASTSADKYLNVRIGNIAYGIENYREAFFRPDLVKVALSGGSLKDYRKLADVKQPPTVSIGDTPKSVNTDHLTVKLHLTDNGGGIGDIRLYLNGTAVAMDSRAVTMVAKEAKAPVKEYILQLSNGRNIIKAVAFNSDNTMQSNEATREVTASFAAGAKPSLSALVIGINDFTNPKLRLNYPVSDAELFATTLEKASAGLFDKVNIRKLTTREATTNLSIIREIKSFQSLRPDDLFVFYIASHGTVDEGEYFLMTSNVGSLRMEKLRTDAISQNMLKELIANIPATKKLIIIDTCNAGALGEAIQVAMLTRGMSEDTALKILSRAVGSTILSASTSVQEALEGYDGHGLFTYILAEGLKGKADKGKTGYIKTTDLADYVDNEVPVLAEKVFKRAQFPTISISGQAFPIGKVH
ncbi:MAG: hypothetical protein CSYNP_03040 [Syntrophus sp. SKADARSKE-3]|nr:hypothetical protein [Syntrophus sp. SKADARSKE-3]